MINYDLQIITSGYLGVTLGDIVTAVAPAIGAYPDYTYQRTEIIDDVIHIYYSDDSTAAQAEVIPLIVYAILAVLGILGIAYLSYELRTVVQTAPTMVYAGIFVAGMFALGYLITSTRGRNGTNSN